MTGDTEFNQPRRRPVALSQSKEDYLFDIASMLATVNLYFRKAEGAPVVNEKRMKQAVELVNEQLAELAKDEDHWA